MAKPASSKPQTAWLEYQRELEKAFASGRATEHTYRPALKALLEDLDSTVTATNEPKRVACGAPDFILTRGSVPLGYVETKDVDEDLDECEASDQLTRYRSSLGNLILTDYLEFRWYVAGELRLTAQLGKADKHHGVTLSDDGIASVATLVTSFLTSQTPTIRSARELAERMAGLAKLIRTIIAAALEEHTHAKVLNEQLQAFRKVLLHELTDDAFADMYAQTICYGLFAARLNHTQAEPFTREHAAYELPKTNPFLRLLFGHIAGPELDDRIAWAVDDLAALLNRTDTTQILKNFGKRSRREDPVVHFYETFLAAYDPALRETRGVYYTPEPVVSYIVNSIDHVLKKEFSLADGLADSSTVTVKTAKQKSTFHRVLLLDPAVGTGTFLYNVIDAIHEQFKGNKGLWSSYVSSHLLPRLFGFEILMAPYAVAHMKLGLQLAQTDYNFEANERLRVYLTNTLEEAHEMTGLPLFTRWLAEEASAAASIKRDAPVMVVLGNPPYSGHSLNKGEWIEELIEDYKKIGDKPVRLGQAKWLHNDYVKFIRFADWRIEQTGSGILAYITDHSYVDSGTFVAMRAQLQRSFDKIYILDLQGNAKRNKNRTGIDDNVFDITQGVAIILAIRKGPGVRDGEVFTAELRGTRDSKYEYLASKTVATTKWEKDSCRAPYYLFVSAGTSHLREYEKFMSITDVMPGSYQNGSSKRIGTGFVSTHDEFAIAFTEEELQDHIKQFLAAKSEAEARATFTLCGQAQWNYERARLALKKGLWKDQIREILYRPFDVRFTVWDPSVCVHRRLEVHKHLDQPNIALCVGQAGNVVGSDEWNLIYATTRPVDFNAFYRGGNAVLPLYLYDSEQTDLFTARSSKAERSANFAVPFIDAVRARTKSSTGRPRCAVGQSFLE